MTRKRTKLLQNRNPGNLATIIGKLILPSVLIILVLILLNSAHPAASITMRLELDKLFFVCDFSQTPSYEFLRALPVQSMTIRHFSPIEVQFKKLFITNSNSSEKLLSTDQSIQFDSRNEPYAEITFQNGAYKVGSLEVGDNAQVGIELRESEFKKSSPGKFKLEINRFASRLHLQVLSDSARIWVKNCSLMIAGHPIPALATNGSGQNFLVIPKKILPVKLINSTNDKLTVNFDFASEVLAAVEIFEVPAAGIPVKRLRLNADSDFLTDASNIYPARCLDLRVNNQIKKEFIGQNVFFRFRSFSDFRIESLRLSSKAGAKLLLQASDKNDALLAGLSQSSLQNITPTYFQKMFDSYWMPLFGFISWLVSTGLTAYRVFRKGN